MRAKFRVGELWSASASASAFLASMVSRLAFAGATRRSRSCEEAMDCSSELLVLCTTRGALLCSAMFSIVVVRAGAAGACSAPRSIFFGGYTTLIDKEDVPLVFMDASAEAGAE